MTKSRGSKNSVVDVVRESAKRKSESTELKPPCFAMKKVGHHHMGGLSFRCFALPIEMIISQLCVCMGMGSFQRNLWVFQWVLSA